jgi:hypothetical protein
VKRPSTRIIVVGSGGEKAVGGKSQSPRYSVSDLE